MATTIQGIEGLRAAVGTHLGSSGWVEITQGRVQRFADATGDQQWIHTDPERAAAGPFGGPIAHGYLTLSLGPVLMDEVFVVDGISLLVNYGANKVRFPAPVPVGSKVRMGIEVVGCEDVRGGVQATFSCTFEVEGATKPSCVAEVVFRYLT